MEVNDTTTSCTPKRSIIFSFLLILLVGVSIMCMPACSSDSDNAAIQPNYIVQATVTVGDDDNYAYASVMDGDKNLVSNLNLTINGDPMTIEYLGGEGRTPIYVMELPDLKEGDTVVFEAADQFGEIIYAPEPAVIPMAIELNEPETGQEIIAGDELLIRWAGGGEAQRIGVLYADNQGAEEYWEVRKHADGDSMTIPTGVIREGGGIIVAAAISGNYPESQPALGTGVQEPYFIVDRFAAIECDARPSAGSEEDIPSVADKPPCPNQPMDAAAASAACIKETQETSGSAKWGARFILDSNNHEPCRFSGGVPSYCANYSIRFSHDIWVSGCLCPGLY